MFKIDIDFTFLTAHVSDQGTSLSYLPCISNLITKVKKVTLVLSSNLKKGIC